MTTPEPAEPAEPATAPKAGRTGTIIAAAIVVLCLGIGVAAGVKNSSGPDAPDQYDAKVMCRTFVERQLKSPSTAEYSDETAANTGTRTWTVTGNVDSQNSFGAQVRSVFRCEMTVSEDYETWTPVSVTVV